MVSTVKMRAAFWVLYRALYLAYSEVSEKRTAYIFQGKNLALVDTEGIGKKKLYTYRRSQESL
jgi:hypothetical protein